MPRSPMSRTLRISLRQQRIPDRRLINGEYYYYAATVYGKGSAKERGRQSGIPYRVFPAGKTGLYYLYLKSEPYAIATASAQRQGYTSFREGEPGQKKRREIVRAIQREEERGRIHRD